MRKKFIPAFAVLAAAVMLSACGRAGTGVHNNNNGSAVTTRGATHNQTTIHDNNRNNTNNHNNRNNNHRETGDIDGDGFIEEVVTHAGNVVQDVGHGLETIVEDVVPGGRPNR